MHLGLVLDRPSSASETCETVGDIETQELFPNLQLERFGECPQEIIKIKIQLIEAAENIQFKFLSFICNTIKSFEERKLPPKDLARAFVHLPGLSSICRDDYEEVMKACSIDDIIKEFCDKK